VGLIPHCPPVNSKGIALKFRIFFLKNLLRLPRGNRISNILKPFDKIISQNRNWFGLVVYGIYESENPKDQ
jgi:hypothetical protein